MAMATTSWLAIGEVEMATNAFLFLLDQCSLPAPTEVTPYTQDTYSMCCTMMGAALMSDRIDLMLNWYRLWEQDGLQRQLSDGQWEDVQNEISIVWARSIALDQTTDWSQNIHVIKDLADVIGNVLIERIFTRAVSNTNTPLLLAMADANLVDQGLGMFLAFRVLSNRSKDDFNVEAVRHVVDRSGVTLDHALLRCTMATAQLPEIWHVSLSGFNGEQLSKWTTTDIPVAQKPEKSLVECLEKLMEFFADQDYNEMFHPLVTNILTRTTEPAPFARAAHARHEMKAALSGEEGANNQPRPKM